jgi:Fe-S cluster assembly iron-binding protein IscA
MTTENLINLTPEAAQALEELLEEQGKEDLALRIYIAGVG